MLSLGLARRGLCVAVGLLPAPAAAAQVTAAIATAIVADRRFEPHQRQAAWPYKPTGHNKRRVHGSRQTVAVRGRVTAPAPTTNAPTRQQSSSPLLQEHERQQVVSAPSSVAVAVG